MWREEDKILLDYYTKNKTVHATIIVAVIFGLFSMIGLILNTKKLIIETYAFWVIILVIFLLSVMYFTLVGFGLYEITRLKHYLEMAKEKAELFGAEDKPRVKKNPLRLWLYQHGDFFFRTSESWFFSLMVLLWLIVLVF